MTDVELEIERKKELSRLIREQAKDMKNYHVLPERFGRGYTYGIDPSLIDDLGLQYDIYHGFCNDDVL